MWTPHLFIHFKTDFGMFRIYQIFRNEFKQAWDSIYQTKLFTDKRIEA